MPVSTSTCLKPPPAATISRMPAIGGSGVGDRLGDGLPVHARGAAEGEHRDEHRDQQRDERVADHVEDLLHAVVRVVDDDVDDRLGHHQHHRQQHRGEGDAERRDGCRRPCPRGPRTGPAAVRRPSDRRAGRTADPTTITVGIATSTPSISVVPRSASRVSIASERTGVRRHQAVHGREAGQRRDADGDHGHLGAPGDQVDDRHQQHQADLEEHRQADERADAGHRPRQHPARGAADDRVDDLVGTAGVGEQLGEHRAERDQRADARGRRTEAGGEAGDDVVDVLPGDDADGEAAEDQRQERVHLEPR